MKSSFSKISVIIICMLACSLPLAAQYNEWNRVLGVPFLNSSGKWTKQSFERSMYSAGLQFGGSSQLRMSRSRCLVLNIAPKEIRANYNSQDMLTAVDVVFTNKGDDGDKKNIRKLIRNTARTLEKKLTASLGNPVKCDYGHKKMQNNALKWKGTSGEIILEYVGSEFVMLHICYPAADAGTGRQEVKFSKKTTDI